MDLEDEKSKKTMKALIMMGQDLKKGMEHQWKKIEFKEARGELGLCHYYGCIFLSRRDFLLADSYFTIGYCLVNMSMAWKEDADVFIVSDADLLQLRDTYLRYKALNALKTQKMVDTINMID